MSHTSKKCRKIWQFIGIFMLTCVVSVLPASLAGAQRATKSTVAQMEKEVGRLELDIPIETSRVGWTYVPILNIVKMIYNYIVDKLIIQTNVR